MARTFDEQLDTPDEAWRPLPPCPVRSWPDARSPELLDQVLDSHRVETAARYAPVGGATWCNVFTTDVAAAMGVVLPKRVDDSGRSVLIGGQELTANLLAAWLEEHGAANGWRKGGPRYVAEMATLFGALAVGVWVNPKGHGHIAPARPEAWVSDVTIANVGKVNFARGPSVRGFGNRDVVWWVHS